MPREGHDPTLVYLTSPQNYFNPRAPRGARHCVFLAAHQLRDISIHVPREGHDEKNYCVLGEVVISIHVPREGHDDGYDYEDAAAGQFQSTCPARGTTLAGVFND